MRNAIVAMIVFTLSVLSGCDMQREYPGEETTSKEVVMPSGLRYIELAPGSGADAQEGMMVSVHYSGFLMDGKKFDSSHDRNEPIMFVLGSGRVIQGWDEGIASMKIGQKRKLIIPPHLAYGERGVPGAIPPDAELVFDVELVDARQLEP